MVSFIRRLHNQNHSLDHVKSFRNIIKLLLYNFHCARSLARATSLYSLSYAMRSFVHKQFLCMYNRYIYVVQQQPTTPTYNFKSNSTLLNVHIIYVCCIFITPSPICIVYQKYSSIIPCLKRLYACFLHIYLHTFILKYT